MLVGESPPCRPQDRCGLQGSEADQALEHTLDETELLPQGTGKAYEPTAE
jgi:hypothetical protein